MTTNEALGADLKERAEELSRSFTSPKVISRKLAEYIRQKWPQRVEEAKWVGVTIRDGGIHVRLWERTFSGVELRAGGLLGKKSAGVLVSAPVWRKDTGATVCIGAGVASPFDDFGHLEPVVALTVKLR